MKILFSGFREKKHSSAGGYDKIVNFPGSHYICDQDVPFSKIPVGQRGKFLNLLFLDMATRWLRYRYDITHLFYGDTIIFPYFKSKRHKIVATVHLDIAQRKRLPGLFLKALRGLDGVIVLSSQQARLFQSLGIKAQFIPHGFSKPIYEVCKPSLFLPNYNNYINIFYSGTNYRDIDVLLKIIRYTQMSNDHILFHAVGQNDIKVLHRLKNSENVVCYPRLTDNEYFTLLSLCDYNFLPLTFATANNALLEAQFLGVRSILPTIEGIKDYAATAPLNLFYTSYNELELIFANLKKESHSIELQNYSDRFLWENVFKQLDSYYKGLLGSHI